MVIPLQQKQQQQSARSPSSSEPLGSLLRCQGSLRLLLCSCCLYNLIRIRTSSPLSRKTGPYRSAEPDIVRHVTEGHAGSWSTSLCTLYHVTRRTCLTGASAFALTFNVQRQ